MDLRWTEEAADDLEAISSYLFANAPGIAHGIVLAIYDAASSLLRFPHRGRPGRKAGRRAEVALKVRLAENAAPPRDGSFNAVDSHGVSENTVPLPEAPPTAVVP